MVVRFGSLLLQNLPMGSVVCPDNLVGTLRPKITRLMGTLNGYPAGCELASFTGSMALDASTLAAMNDGTVLLVNGRLEVPEPLPAELLERKLTWIMGHGSVLCSEENAPLLRSLMADWARFTCVWEITRASCVTARRRRTSRMTATEGSGIPPTWPCSDGGSTAPPSRLAPCPPRSGPCSSDGCFGSVAWRCEALFQEEK